MENSGGMDARSDEVTAFPPLRLNRIIPYPQSISPMARTMLAVLGTRPGQGDWPAQDDVVGWEARIAEQDDFLVRALSGSGEPDQLPVTRIADIPCFDMAPPEIAPTNSDYICLYLHGGAMIFGGGQACGWMNDQFMRGARMRSIAVDYRMPPRHPFPAALDDCYAVYRAMLEAFPAERIIVGGGSAGANLAAAVALRARDEGAPLPRALLLLTSAIDLTESGDSFETVMGLDPILSERLPAAIALYANGNDLTTPYVSPLFADYAKGFPPCLIQAGTRDLFLSNAVRLHRALRAHDLPAELHIFEAMPHGGFGGHTPEDAELYDEIRRYIAAL